MKLKSLFLILAAGWIGFSCGTTTISSDMEADWISNAEAGALSSAHVMENGNYIYLADSRSAVLIDGETGLPLKTYSDSFWQMMANNLETTAVNRLIGGSLRGSDMVADAYNFYPLPEAGVMLLLDYRFTEEIIAALDVNSGEEMWRAEGLSYSGGHLTSAVEAAGGRAGRRLASMLGAQHEEESAEDRRERRVGFMEKVILPYKNGFFLKTSDGFTFYDAGSGDIVFSVDGFNGTGISDVLQIESDDYIVLSSGRDIAGITASSSYHIARISPEGDVLWQSDHNGRRTQQLVLAEQAGVVLVDGYPTQAFDLNDGAMLWENDTRRGNEYHHMVVDGDYVYIASDERGTTARVSESRVEKRNLRSGEVSWQTDRTRNAVFYDAFLHGDHLIVIGTGRFFDGNRRGIIAYDAQTGDVAWRTPEIRDFSNAVLQEGDTLYYIADGKFIGVDPVTGQTRLETPLGDQSGHFGLGFFKHGDKIVSIGTGGVTAFNPENGRIIYNVRNRDGAESFQVFGDVAALHRNSRNVRLVNLNDGTLSNVVRRNNDRRYFGDLDGFIFVNAEEKFALSLGDSGRLMRHSFSWVSSEETADN